MTSRISDLREEISSIIKSTLNEAESRWQAKQDTWQAKQDAREVALSRWHAELKVMFASLGAHIAKGPTGNSSIAAPNPDSSNEEWNNYLTSSNPSEPIGPYEPRNKNRKRFRGSPSNSDDLQSIEYVPTSWNYDYLKSTADSFPPPPRSKDICAHLKRQETYAKRAVHHFNSVEDTRFEFTGLISSYPSETGDTRLVTFTVNQPENGYTAARFSAEVAEDEVRGCAVCDPTELVAEFQAKHAISKYNKEKGAAYEVAEILHFHDAVFIGCERGGCWSHFNFMAVSKNSSNKSPVLFFCEAKTVDVYEKEIGCCIVDSQHPEATYECEMCPRETNIWHPSQSPVGGLVRGPAFAACHFDGNDIIGCCV